MSLSSIVFLVYSYMNPFPNKYFDVILVSDFIILTDLKMLVRLPVRLTALSSPVL